MRRNDVYLAPSRNDPCSNALLEALACGLPAVFRASGGHPELVGEAGVPFDEPTRFPTRSTGSSPSSTSGGRRSAIAPLAEVADRYLEVLGVP